MRAADQMAMVGETTGRMEAISLTGPARNESETAARRVLPAPAQIRRVSELALRVLMSGSTNSSLPSATRDPR